jgi:hypothetical protein
MLQILTAYAQISGGLVFFPARSESCYSPEHENAPRPSILKNLTSGIMKTAELIQELDRLKAIMIERAFNLSDTLRCPRNSGNGLRVADLRRRLLVAEQQFAVVDMPTAA